MRLWEIKIRFDEVYWVESDTWRVTATGVDEALDKVREIPEFRALLARARGLKVSLAPGA